MSLEVDVLRALAHPVRLRILSLLTGTSMSAAELARELDITQANASYHLRQLAAAGHVVEAGERTVRGGVAKLYRYPWERPPVDLPVDDEGRRLYVQTLASEMVRRHALQQVGVRGRQSITDAELWVEPEVWRKVVEATGEASELLHARAQAPGTEGTIRVSMTAVLFQMRSDDPDPAEEET